MAGPVNIDLGLLEAERRGQVERPAHRKATEAQRNEAAAQSVYGRLHGSPHWVDFPETVISVEEHLRAKGRSEGQISEALLDLAKHQDETTKPGPDLTYFSEWENAVGLHHPQVGDCITGLPGGDKVVVSVVSAEEILDDIAEAFDELDCYNAELGKVGGFAHVDLAEFEKRQQEAKARHEAWLKTQAPTVNTQLGGWPSRDPIREKIERAKTQASTANSVRRWAAEIKDGIKSAPITDEAIQQALAEYRAAFPAHQSWHVNTRTEASGERQFKCSNCRQWIYAKNWNKHTCKAVHGA